MVQSYPASGTLRDGLWIKPKSSQFSPEQVSQYLSAIDYEPIYDAKAIASGSFPVNKETLERVMRLHLLTFPFENTGMHYTPGHNMDVSMEGVFSRIVLNKMGSYCFGQNGLLLEILRGLGFRAYGVGGRFNMAGPGGAQFHCANTHLVILAQPTAGSNETYVVDVGLGSTNLMRPLLLSTDPNNFVYGMTETECHRMVLEPLQESSLASSSDSSSTAYPHWMVEVGHRPSPDSKEETWHKQYAFTELEIFQRDMLHSSFPISQMPTPTGLCWNNVVCVKVFTVDEGNQRIERSKRPMYRMILFGNELKRSLGTKSELVSTFETEVDRIRALREVFGVKLRDEDELHIAGRASALSKSKH